MDKRLIKGTNPMIFGVCSGIADYLDTDVTIVRFVTIILSFCYGIGILPYIIMAICMPKK